MSAKPGWRRMLPVHTMRVGDVALEEELLRRGAVDAVGEEERVAHPRGVGTVGGARPHDLVVVAREHVVELREVVPPAAVELGELVHLHEAVGGHDLGRLEVVAHVVEHEDQVVRRAVGSGPKRSSVPLRLPNR